MLYMITTECLGEGGLLGILLEVLSFPCRRESRLENWITTQLLLLGITIMSLLGGVAFAAIQIKNIILKVEKK